MTGISTGLFSPPAWGWSDAGRKRDRQRSCFPHPRGDGPQLLSENSHYCCRFSPHAWGWSVSLISAGDVKLERNVRVFPTRVGMVRRTNSGSFLKFDVFPTRVGMVRISEADSAWAARFPHTRGDGPAFDARCCVKIMFSPHAWGWSIKPHTILRNNSVFPTRVGMVRDRANGSRTSCCFPHTRGDGPTTPGKGGSDWRFPHTRGDGPRSAARRRTLPGFPNTRGDGPLADELQQDGPCVFPTRVGMVRIMSRCSLRRSSFPHTRGDGPSIVSGMSTPRSFSPHAWGWSAAVLDRPELADVFPTRVGMVRLIAVYPLRHCRFPHTRGDGPRRNEFIGQFSPHAWGWSDCPQL